MDGNMSTETINIQEVCRLCLSVDAFRLPIFHDSLDKQVSITLSDRIFACLNIKVSLNDTLSHLICHRCLYKVDEFYQFKISCLKSDVLLNETKKRAAVENPSNIPWSPCEESVEERKDDISSQVFHPPETEPQVNSSSAETEENQEERQDPEMSQPCLAPSNLVVALLEDEENAGPEAQAPYPEGRVEGNPWYDRSHCEMEKPFQIPSSDVSSQSTLKAFNFRNLSTTKSRSPKKRKTNENSVRNSSRVSAETGKVKKYSCNQCSMSFNFRSNLLRHERVHSGERPFKCTICSKSFSQNEHLVRHDRVHSKNSQVLTAYEGQEL